MNDASGAGLIGFILTISIAGAAWLLGPFTVAGLSVFPLAVAAGGTCALYLAITSYGQTATIFFLLSVAAGAVLSGMYFAVPELGAFVGALAVGLTAIVDEPETAPVNGPFGVAMAAAVVGYLHGPCSIAGARLLVVALAVMAVFHTLYILQGESTSAITIPVTLGAYGASIWGLLSGNLALGRNIAIGLVAVLLLITATRAATTEIRSQQAARGDGQLDD